MDKNHRFCYETSVELAGLAPAGRWMESRALHSAAPLGDWPSRQRNDDQPDIRSYLLMSHFPDRLHGLALGLRQKP